MEAISEDRKGRQGFTLEKAVGVALLLHVLFGAGVTWWPGLLQPALAEPPPDPAPLEFRFVDTPESEPPLETPDTNVLSDIDREAADASPLDDQPTPFSEGNTPENLVRVPQLPSETVVAEEPTPTAPETTPEPVEAEPEAQPAEEPEGEVGDPVESPEAAAETVQPAEAEAAPPTPRIPPRRKNLRNSLAQLESYIDPQVYDNPRGGVDGPQSLAQFDTRGYDLGPYLRQVLSTIERNWRASMPPLIQTGVGGATFIALSIRRQRQPDGTESAVLVAERTWSSGQPAYDSAALFSFDLSNPLPAIPDFYPHETIEGRLGFVYNLDPREVDFPEQ